MAGDTSHIVQSLVTNLIIATAKGAGAFYTGSGAMLAETLHSFADCGNQILLLVGVKQAQRPSDATHPLGYGRNVYFWSFMVAMLLFSGGGMFSIYEGIHKLTEESHEGVESAWVGMLILVGSLLLEGSATFGNVREMNKRRGSKPFMRYIKETKDSDLIVVFGENSAATLGLSFALAAVSLSYVTHNPVWDSVGSIGIGVILILVAVFLAVEVKSLLVGESADPEIGEAARAIALAHPSIDSVLNLITVQQGPGEVLVAIKLSFKADMNTAAISNTINEFESQLRERSPEARWIFVEPDLPR